MRIDRVKALRKAHKWSQIVLAEKMNVSRSTVAMWEVEANEIPLSTLEQLADVLGTSLGYLIGTTDNPAPEAPAEYGVPENELSFPSNVRPISSLHRQRVPLIGGVAAGEPIYDPEDAGVYVESPVDADAAITIHGDSMVPTYQDGDLVYIKARPDVPEGAVAVVFLDDEATLKHVYKRPTGLTLISDNMTSHPPIMVEFEDYANVRIFGVPVGYTRIYKPGIAGKIKKGF